MRLFYLRAFLEIYIPGSN